MNYSTLKLPKGVVKVWESPLFNYQNSPDTILTSHAPPMGNYGFLVVFSGNLKVVWEDVITKPYDSDPSHPVVIEPERPHHIKLCGPVSFKIEFYRDPEAQIIKCARYNAVRPFKKE